jgi:hypothetical protein
MVAQLTFRLAAICLIVVSGLGEHTRRRSPLRERPTSRYGGARAAGVGLRPLHRRFRDGRLRSSPLFWEWTNLDPVTPHTVTFGFPIEPAPPQPPSGNVTVDSDGALHAALPSLSPPVGDVDVHSGFLQAAFQDRGPPPPPPPALFPAPLAQSPLGVTRFRVTFTTPGTFNYRCVLHDDLGMTGRVIVHR